MRFRHSWDFMQAIQHLLSSDDILVVTDTETTGLNAHVNRVIELAAQRVTPISSDEWFSELINPGIHIPGNITRITGISTSMVYAKPGAEVVMPLFEEFLSDSIFVAHNINFDLSFINAEFERAGLQRMTNQGLCSLRLARRLLPGLRSKSLGNLARFFKIPGEGRHRAAKDVEITTLVLDRLARIAIEEHKVDSIAELVSMQSKTYAKVNPFSKHVVQIRRDVLPSLPPTPGVYYMQDGRGKTLYVGKAKTLSKRVSSYFTAIEAHPPRLRQLISKVRTIRWDVTDTELHALVLESRQIKEMDPPFNRAQKKYIPRPYLRVNQADAFPSVTVQVIVRNDGALYYGPLRNRSQANILVEIIEKYLPLRTCSTTEFSGGKHCVRADIGRCHAPCEGGISESDYSDIIRKVTDFLEGDIAEICLLIEADMLRAAERLSFEEAAALRDWIELLDSRVVQYGSVAPPVHGPAFIHLCRSVEAELGTFVLVESGRIVSVEAIQSSEQVEELAFNAFAQKDVSSSALDRIQIDARRILDHWLYVNRQRVESIEKRPEESERAFSNRAQQVYTQLLSSAPGASVQ